MRRLTAAIAATAALLIVTGCTSTGAIPSADRTTTPPGIDSHESGPASPIGYGISVPDGATQLGPLVRYRSERLIDAYKPELDAVRAEQALEEAAEAEEDGEATEPTPTPTPTLDTRPEGDLFEDLDDPPRPDTFVSLMRVDGNPTLVLRRMLADLSVLLPEAQIVTDDLAAYCKATDRRITGCKLDVTGVSPGGRDLHVVLTVDPGRVPTRTGNYASLERPVMTLSLAYVGDPRTGQEERSPEDLADPPKVEDTDEKTGWIWPKMDEDAPELVLDGYTPPTSATVLLSGERPAFATMTTPRASIATEIATAFTQGRVPEAALKRDVVADLNEVIITTWGTGADGRRIRTVHTLSARGNYLALFVDPTV
ncbi:hypothetical protein GL325_13760 [Aeromicrobium sp. 636]|uniref:GerMN domain-containing protein n=1 Tax=Aeromicrobium senzhongii TaxID=2663859 RepID=A0A8I0EXG5_9ACTN|nr:MULTISPECIES: hypothetical protein [Aeromicrobium]MBC9227389.1 hypothetical protein [Aeromicrobium senzhongii]MCQ3999486.1 hypothetical protein [Aeromicrobium sp. 636]